MSQGQAVLSSALVISRGRWVSSVSGTAWIERSSVTLSDVPHGQMPRLRSLALSPRPTDVLGR